MKIKEFLSKIRLLLAKSWKHRIIFIISIVLLGVLIFLLVFGISMKTCSEGGDDEARDEEQDQDRNYDLPESVRTIDGLPAAKETNNFLPLAVVIENIVGVRPQSGLSSASLVYEALAEGGITRFLAVYSGAQASEIGPVRSARIYHLDWVSELDALFSHCGGDPYALGLIAGYGIKDLDQMYNGTFYWRKPELSAPHDLFTTSEYLDQGRQSKAWEDQGNFVPWLFKEEKPLAERPENVRDIEVGFLGQGYRVTWQYDRENNFYRRLNGGVPHIDKNTGEQITAKNVVVQFMVAKLKDAGAAAGRLGMHTIGGDQALIFRDGEVVPGIWKKKYREDRTRFYTPDWQEIEFNPGTTWIEVLPLEREVTY